MMMPYGKDQFRSIIWNGSRNRIHGRSRLANLPRERARSAPAPERAAQNAGRRRRAASARRYRAPQRSSRRRAADASAETARRSKPAPPRPWRSALSRPAIGTSRSAKVSSSRQAATTRLAGSHQGTLRAGKGQSLRRMTLAVKPQHGTALIFSSVVRRMRSPFRMPTAFAPPAKTPIPTFPPMIVFSLVLAFPS
jgi:hypothetical protein